MPNDERVRRDDLALRERPAVRAPHQLVAVALDPAVDRVGAAGGQRAADDDRERSSPSGGNPCSARNIGGTAVTSSSSMTRGFVSRRYAPNVAPAARSGRRGGARAEPWSGSCRGRPATMTSLDDDRALHARAAWPGIVHSKSYVAGFEA